MFLDTAGTERFEAMMPSFYRKVDAFVFVYDITNRDSFKGLTNRLVAVDHHPRPSTPYMNHEDGKFMVIGNKTDLEDERSVSYEEGMEFAKERQMRFFETSAKTGANVEHAMDSLANDLHVRVRVHEHAIGREHIEHCNVSVQVDEVSKKPSGVCRCWPSSPSTSDRSNSSGMHNGNGRSGSAASIAAKCEST